MCVVPYSNYLAIRFFALILILILILFTFCPQVYLFYCDETEELARRIAAETDAIQLQSIKWRYVSISYILGTSPLCVLMKIVSI
jgi:hypothetical protein